MKLLRRTATILMGLGVASTACAQQSSAYGQAQHFIEQLSVHKGVIAWSGLEVGTQLTEVKRKWSKPLNLARSNDEHGRSFSNVIKDGVTVRLSFFNQSGSTIFDEVCASKTVALDTKEVGALQRLALNHLRGLSRPSPGAPPDEPLSTDSSELAIGPEGICVRVGTAY